MMLPGCYIILKSTDRIPNPPVLNNGWTDATVLQFSVLNKYYLNNNLRKRHIVKLSVYLNIVW